MNTESEYKQLMALAALLIAKGEEWTEINFHRGAQDLYLIADKLEALARIARTGYYPRRLDEAPDIPHR
jgi:hypothetical protein